MLDPKNLENGEQQYEEYVSAEGKSLVQYDFRNFDGELFSCVAKTLEAAMTKIEKQIKARMERRNRTA